MSEESTITRLTQDIDCPFCTGSYFGAQCDEVGSVIHSIPICVTFEELDPVDFLEAARLTREGVKH